MAATSHETRPLRSPAELMQPERLGALQATELSFSRSLMRKMIRERWQIEPVHFAIDERARGDALYRIDTGTARFHFIVFSFEPVYDELRTPRIIGRRWDMFGALVEGEATPEIIEHTRQEWAKLYAGRATPQTLVWCRSNRSSRAFDHTVERLAAGRQPDLATVAEVGYLMRNTGLDGNGTFGTKSYLAYEPDHPLRTPYHAQMLCAFLMREFAADLVEHLARCRSPRAARLDPALRRYLGLGNGSALGLGFWVINHPHWVHHWLELRERALAHAQAQEATPNSPEVTRFLTLLDRTITYREQDRIKDYGGFAESKLVAAELRQVRPLIEEYQRQGTIAGQPTNHPWATLCARLPAGLCAETEETVHALVSDVYPAFADAVEAAHRVPEVFELEPAMPAGELLELLRREWSWAYAFDMSAPGARYYTWYKSEEAEEPRRGPRHEVEGGYELGIDFPGEVQRLTRLLEDYDPTRPVGEFLLDHPDTYAFIERVQSLRGLLYSTPHMNMFDEHFIPAYLTRLVCVPFFGLTKTRARLNRALTGLIHEGAPTAADIAAGWDGEWWHPAEPEL